MRWQEWKIKEIWMKIMIRKTIQHTRNRLMFLKSRNWVKDIYTAKIKIKQKQEWKWKWNQKWFDHSIETRNKKKHKNFSKSENRTFKCSRRGPINSPPPTPNNDVNIPITSATMGRVEEKSDHMMSPKIHVERV
jgi:hypothetical protein